MHATGIRQVTLTRSLTALRPGTYGIEGPGVHAVVGPVVEGAESTADTVVRTLERVTHGILEPGDKVRLTPEVYRGTPAPPSAWSTGRSRSPASLADCPPGGSPATATPGSSPRTASAPPASTP